MFFWIMNRTMDEVLIKKLSTIKFSLVMALLFFMACTSPQEVRIPNEEVMHFPYSMALMGNTLVVASASSDKKYDFGRLVSLDTNAIKKAVLSTGEKAPIPWNSVVKSNFLIPQDASELSFSKNYLTFANRENSQLIAVPLKNGTPVCNDPFMRADACEGARTLTLPEYDPFSVVIIESNDKEEFILVSYLSSDRIDLIHNDKAQNAMSIKKSFRASEWLSAKLKTDALKNRRVITRKMRTTETKAYFLFEQHPKKTNAPVRPKGAMLAAIKTNDLQQGNDKTIEFWNLSDFYIDGAQDFYIDEASNVAYILGRVPEALYRIDLAQKTLIDTKVLCRGASIMAVSAAKDMIVTPCAADNRLASFSLSSLELKGSSNIMGRGPSYVVIDEVNDLIYCSFTIGGFVAIFNNKLELLGHVFDKAPYNRVGS